MKRTLGIFAIALVAAACGDRPESYEQEVTPNAESFALTNRVAVIDKNADRVGLFVPTADSRLDRSFVPIGKNELRAEVSPDGKRLFVLSAGDVPRRKYKN